MNKNFISSAQNLIEIEQKTIANLKNQLDGNFEDACQSILDISGKVIIIGLGKSGHIGNKIAATLASTGTSAFFINAAEANHGDLGMIDKNDIVMAISYSGRTDELLNLVPRLKHIGVKMIAITGNQKSPLARKSDILLHIPIAKEACPHNLAPTSSTTATLVLGDALAIALLEAKNFSAEDFAKSHPAGQLGRQLNLRVKDLMVTDDAIPKVAESTSLRDAILMMNEKKLGMTCVTNDQQQMLGVFTDGDLRRALTAHSNPNSVIMNQIMSTSVKTISANTLAKDALSIMQENKITSLAILDQNKHIEGILHIHHLLQSGIIE